MIHAEHPPCIVCIIMLSCYNVLLCNSVTMCRKSTHYWPIEHEYTRVCSRMYSGFLYAADAANIALGKQRLRPEGTWFTATSGIWQTVWLEPVGRSSSSLCLALLHDCCCTHPSSIYHPGGLPSSLALSSACPSALPLCPAPLPCSSACPQLLSNPA